MDISWKNDYVIFFASYKEYLLDPTVHLKHPDKMCLLRKCETSLWCQVEGAIVETGLRPGEWKSWKTEANWNTMDYLEHFTPKEHDTCRFIVRPISPLS